MTRAGWTSAAQELEPDVKIVTPVTLHFRYRIRNANLREFQRIYAKKNTKKIRGNSL